MIWGLKEKQNGKFTCEGTRGFWQPGGMYNNIRAWDVNIEYESGIKLYFTDIDCANSSGILNYLPFKDGNGTAIYDPKGWISIGRNTAQSNIPEINAKLNDKSFPHNSNGTLAVENDTMVQLFIDVVKGKVAETCPLNEAMLSDSVSHMSNIAPCIGRKITWYPNAGQVDGDAEATIMYDWEKRAPYQV